MLKSVDRIGSDYYGDNYQLVDTEFVRVFNVPYSGNMLISQCIVENIVVTYETNHNNVVNSITKYILAQSDAFNNAAYYDYYRISVLSYIKTHYPIYLNDLREKLNQFELLK